MICCMSATGQKIPSDRFWFPDRPFTRSRVIPDPQSRVRERAVDLTIMDAGRRALELDGVACGPVPSLHVDIDVNGNLERDMVAMMEAQRRELPQVGGFCQLTTLTQHTVTQRILRGGPRDRREPAQPGQEKLCARPLVCILAPRC